MGRKVGTSRYSGAAGSRRRVFLFRRVRWNDSNRGPLAKQGRLTWLRNLIQPRSTRHPEDPKEAAKADREMDGNFMAGLVGTFPASDPVSATQPGTRTGSPNPLWID